jgi:hypothetical protein
MSQLSILAPYLYQLHVVSHLLVVSRLSRLYDALLESVVDSSIAASLELATWNETRDLAN